MDTRNTAVWDAPSTIYILSGLNQFRYKSYDVEPRTELSIAVQGCLVQCGVDGEVSPPILLVLNLTQLKSRGIRLW